MIKEKDNKLTEMFFRSDVLGDTRVDEKLPKKMDDEKIKGLAENSVHERTVSECKKLWYLIHNVVGKYQIVMSVNNME